MNRAQNIHQELREAGDRGICLADLPMDRAYTARNAISELRAAEVAIESFPCKIHQHRSSVSRYRLAPKGQLALL